jgi:hypothetical protein
MEIIEHVEKIDNKINTVIKDYKYIYDNIHNYLNDGKVSYHDLIDFEISLEDLSIHLNSLVFLFKQKQTECINYNSFETNTNNTNNTETKLDYVIDKTIFHFIPLLFIYFMIFDKESILYAKDFIENKYNNNNNNNNNNNSSNSNNSSNNNNSSNSNSSIKNNNIIINDQLFIIEEIDE